MPRLNRDVYASAALRQLQDAQRVLALPALCRCCGTHGLLLGAEAGAPPPALPALACWTALRIVHGQCRGDLRARLDERLPFIDEAFAVVFADHALDVAVDADSLLDEAIRVLAPGGTLVLTGIHPASAWMPWLCWRRHGATPGMPAWPLHLRRRLALAGLDVCALQRVGSLLPGAAPGGRFGRLWGGGYVLVAHKSRHLVLPLRLRALPVATRGRPLSPGVRLGLAA